MSDAEIDANVERLAADTDPGLLVGVLKGELVVALTELAAKDKELETYRETHAKCCVAMINYIPAFGRLEDAIHALGKERKP